MKNKDPKITIVTKKNSRKYAYRAVGHTWNSEKKRYETKLEYYGTVDEEGNVIPKRQKLVKADVVESEEKERKVSLTMLDEKRIGMVRVLWQIASDTRLADTLREVFPKTWKAILSVAFFYGSLGRNAAYLFEGWKEDHETPLGSLDLKDGEISILFKSMKEEDRKEFLKRWRK